MVKHGVIRSALVALGLSLALLLVGANSSMAAEKSAPTPYDTVLQPADDVTTDISGGGCRNTRAIGSCISFRSGTTNPLLSDFYFNYWDGCQAKLWMVINGSYVYKYHVVLDHLGHYPIAQYTVSGRGSAYTHVEVYNCSGGYMYSANSPYQYW